MVDRVDLFLSLVVLSREQYCIVLEVILDANTVLHPFHGGWFQDLLWMPESLDVQVLYIKWPNVWTGPTDIVILSHL